MSPLDRLLAAISRAALAFSEQRARMGGKRAPKQKKRPGKVGRVNKFKNAAGTGCGTGAGGFKAGNSCQKEDGIPNSPQKPYIAKSFAQKGKSGKAASLPATKEALAAKTQALKGVYKSAKISDARKKAAVRKKEKEAKASEEAKQRAEALAKKKAEMLKVIRKKRADEKLNIIGDKTVDVQQISKNKAQKASQFLKIVDGRADSDVYSSAAKEMVDSVKRAKNSSQCKGTSVGLCSYISEDVTNRLSEQFKDRPHIEVLQHMPQGRDHASVVIVNHKDKTAIEVDISEAKYQRRTKTGKFIKVKDPKITEKDVEFRDLDYSQFSSGGATGRAKSVFTGRGDKSLAKKAGETDIEHAQRVYKQDLDTLHAEADRIIEATKNRTKPLEKAREDLMAELRSAKQSLFSGKSPTKKQESEWRKKIDETNAKARDLHDQVRQEQKKADDDIRSLVGEFTKAHSGGLAKVSIKAEDYEFTLLPGGSSGGMNRVKAEAASAWTFLSRVSSPKHLEAFKESKIAVRKGEGGSHSVDKKTIVIGEDGFLTDGTLVHEYGHAIESRLNDSMTRITQDYKKRLAEFLSKNPGATVKRDYVDYYEGPFLPAGTVRPAGSLNESLLGYYNRYADFGFDRKTIQSHPNNPRYNVGTEVFSTGVQALYLDANGLRTKARHHFNLTVLMLAGLI